MSDTPRTDAACFAVVSNDPKSVVVWAGVARDLERENAALREDRDRLDWLEANLYTLFACGLRLNETPPVEIAARGGRYEAESIRAAIDAARAKEGQP